MSTDEHPPPFRVTANLGIEGDQFRERVTVTAQWDGRRLSIAGNRGQNIESVTAARPFPHDGRTDADRARIRAIWERWHLNDARAGCPHQERGRRLWGEAPTRGRYGRPSWYDHTRAAAAVECRVCGYSYGSAWNYEPVPDEILAELRRLLDDDAHMIEAPDLDDDEEEPEEFPHGDYVDSQELIGRTFGPEIDAEIAEAESYAGEWNHHATLIAASHFEDYAREFAQDIGRVSGDEEWPLDHIDWAAAARDLAQDFTSVTIDGTEYMVRQ